MFSGLNVVNLFNLIEIAKEKNLTPAREKVPSPASNSLQQEEDRFVLSQSPANGANTLSKDRQIDKFIKDLSSNDENTRRKAQDYLLNHLRNCDFKDKVFIARQIGETGKGSKEAVNVLVGLLKFNDVPLEDNDLRVMYGAISALGEIANDSKEAVDILISLLKHSKFSVREDAAGALRNVEGDLKDKVIDALIPLLKDEHPIVRQRAIRTLGDIGKDSKKVNDVINALIAVLKDTEEKYDLKEDAIVVLGDIGKDSKEAADALTPFLNDTNKEVRKKAAFALGNIGYGSKELVSALITLLKDNDTNVQDDAVRALGNIRRGSQEVIDALIPLLKDPKSMVRQHAASTLGNIGKDSKEVIDALVPLLKDSDFEVRNEVMRSLANIAKGSEEAARALLQLLKDGDIDIRAQALQIFSVQKESKELVDALVPLLKDPDSLIRLEAATMLYRLKRNSKEVIDALIPLLKSTNGIVESDIRYRRIQAMAILRNIAKGSKEQSKEMIDAIKPLIKDHDRLVSFQALLSLYELGEHSEEVISGLINALDDEVVSSRAQKSLVAIGKNAVPHLIPKLDTARGDAAIALVEILSGIGEDAVDGLLAASAKDNEFTRGHSALALGIIATKKLSREKLKEIITRLKYIAENDKKRDVRKIAIEALGDIGLKLEPLDEELKSIEVTLTSIINNKDTRKEIKNITQLALRRIKSKQDVKK